MSADRMESARCESIGDKPIHRLLRSKDANRENVLEILHHPFAYEATVSGCEAEAA
jgi:hypothetical protein